MLLQSAICFLLLGKEHVLSRPWEPENIDDLMDRCVGLPATAACVHAFLRDA